MFLYSFDFQIITQRSSFNASTGRVWGCLQGQGVTKNPPPFRLASLINRKTHTFKTLTHHRKTQTFSGQTEPRNRKSRKVRKSGVARKSREYRESGIARKSSALAGLGISQEPALARTRFRSAGYSLGFPRGRWLSEGRDFARQGRVAKRNGGGVIVDECGCVTPKLARAGGFGKAALLARAQH